ncbi:response regulator transcription factor [Paenibacillus luteus]|uniref:response regulator transcription factor n=1 Tax=Paenibacillus luteus TaxID=2545753 RepID=UPI0011445CAE|nr:response regulator transcription factor [Paenibacillus luteus]
MKPITIVVADDQMLTREGLRTILDLEEDMEVVGVAINGLEACDLASSLHPDVVLLDIRMPTMNGIEALKIIRGSCPNTAILILTTFLEDQYILEAMANGAQGYILKDMDGDRMIASIRDIAAGQFVLPTAVAARLAARASELADSHKQTGTYFGGSHQLRLTEREREIAGLMLQGLSNREIAGAMHVTEGTARNYISNLYGKLEVGERVQAIMRLQELLKE